MDTGGITTIMLGGTYTTGATITEGADDTSESIWQPMLVMTDTPLLCECGKPAIIAVVDGQAPDYDLETWCQECFEKDDEEEGD